MDYRRSVILPFVIGAACLLWMGGCSRSRPPTPTGLDRPVAPAIPASTAASITTIGMSGSEFSPDYLVVAAGTTVTFLNNDSVRHSVTPDLPRAGAPDSSKDFPDGMQPNDQYQWNVPLNAKDGTAWYVHCRFHGQAGDGTRPGNGMSAVIEVGPTGGGKRQTTEPPWRTGDDRFAPPHP